MDKYESRLKFRSVRDGIFKKYSEIFGKRIFDNIIKTETYKNSDLVLCYVSVGSEVDTSLIIEKALSDGKTVAVPFCTDDFMSFRQIDSLENLVIGKFGIPTSECEIDLDFSLYHSVMCIVPCLSVDEDFNRLGYGGGYYDRFLADHINILSVALCYDACLSYDLPTDDFDIPVNGVVTESNVLGGV